jgi:heterodisulfide reductase subunit B
MNTGYYPGCSTHGTAQEFDLSTKAIFKKLDIEIPEIEEWNCCGTSPAHQTNEELSLALPYRVLAIAESQGFDTILSPCAACYNRLKFVEKEIKKEPSLNSRLMEISGENYGQKVKIRHILDFLDKDVTLKKVNEKVINPLTSLNAVSYYGCLLTRPKNVTDLDPDIENPTIMDKVVECTGAKAIFWPYKVECCGAGLGVTQPKIALRLINEILITANDYKADCIIVACPLCHVNLDMKQQQAAKEFNRSYQLPIIYITQLIGLAFGIGYRELGLHKNITSPFNLVNEKVYSLEGKL